MQQNESEKETKERGTLGTYANLGNTQVIMSELGNHGFFLNSLFYSEPSGGPMYQVKEEKMPLEPKFMTFFIASMFFIPPSYKNCNLSLFLINFSAS